MNNLNNLSELKKEYLYMLKENIIPFWLKNGLDKKNGGYWTALDRKGSVIDRDKSVWFQGRFAWVLSTLYVDFDKKEEYLEAAKLGIDFLEKYCFDKDGDGRMFFRVTEDGKCVIKRLRYYFSETFCIIAMASYSRASGDKSYITKARELLERIEKIKNGLAKFHRDCIVPKRLFSLRIKMFLLEIKVRLYIYYNILCFLCPLFLIPERLQALS